MRDRTPSRAAIAVIAIAGAGAALGSRWITDPFHRVVLWGLLVWLLFEGVEAVLLWDRHPWKPNLFAVVSPLRDRVPLLLVLPIAVVLLGIGVALISAAVSDRNASDLWMLIGGLVSFIAICAVVLAAPANRLQAGSSGSSGRGIDP